MTEKNRPIVLTFSASDSAGLAGMQMDIRTQSAMGVHTASVITANTAQHNQQVFSVNEVDDLVFQQQIAANCELNFSVIKAGLLLTPQQIESVIEVTRLCGKPLIVDPVVKSTSGAEFSSDEMLQSIKYNLLPATYLLTPNLDEAQKLSGISILQQSDIEKIADKLLQLGCHSVLIKGGHADLGRHQKSYSQDYFSDGKRRFWLSSPRQIVSNTRGTGCALASSIAAAIAKGFSIYDAVVIGKMAINQGLRKGYGLIEQKGCVWIESFPGEQQDLPFLTQNAEFDFETFHPSSDTVNCHNEKPLGLYPVVDRAAWLTRLLPQGITTIQLRIKDLQGHALAEEIQAAVDISRDYNARLFINDHWQLAIEKGAYGVHLGQDDLDDADIPAIQRAGLKLGTSTHCHYEVARAHAYKPSYIACGPVYETQTKIMPWIPHGLLGLNYWRQLLEYPLVAIGGINAERLQRVAQTQVSGVAMITAITLAEQPEQTTQAFVKIIKRAQNDSR